MERRHILVEFVQTLTFLAFRLLHNWCQWLRWTIDGTSRLKRQKDHPDQYSSSAQLLSVWRKHAFDPFMLHNTDGNFILRHQDFVHPRYVLKDEVSFYCLTSTEAIFVEAPPGVEVWRNEVSPFHKHAQYENAVNVIRMPLHAFHRLAEELGPIQETLIFTEFIPRSGSTLLCRIFEETGECVAYSEPHALNDMFGAYLKNDDPEGNKRSIHAQVRILCKPRSQSNKAFMFKMLPSQLQSKVLGSYLRELFPQAKYLFLYRDGAPMAKSLHKMMQQVNGVRLINLIQNTFPSLWQKLRVKFAAIGQDFPPEIYDILNSTEHIEYLTCGIFWALSVQGHIHNTSKTAALKYEDIVDCPEASIRAIFTHCGLSEKLVPKALKALEGDSQHCLGLSWEELVQTGWSKGDLSSKSKQAKMEMDIICSHYGVPKLSEDCKLPNTITVNAMDNNNYLIDNNNNAMDSNNNNMENNNNMQQVNYNVSSPSS